MWDKRYSELGFAYGKTVNDFLKQKYQLIPAGGKVLCLAEGEGRNAVFLAKLGYQVTAVDLSEVGLNKALKLARENNTEISIVVADLANFELGTNEWDAIVSIFAHVPEKIRKRVHAQIMPALHKHGIFILEAYTYKHIEMKGIGGPPATQKGMFNSLNDLMQELNTLDMIVGHESQRDIFEGKYHQGESAVVQFVALKK